MNLIDWHAHMLAPHLAPPQGATGKWPGVQVNGEVAELTLGGQFYRAIDQRTFAVEPRLADMDATGVGMQVLSPPPYAVAFDGPPAEFAALAAQQNDFLASVCNSSPERFRMLGMLPYGGARAVSAEIARLAKMPQVAGICLSAHHNDDLADSAHADFWATVASHRWLVFIHPVDTSMCDCDVASGAKFGAAMPIGTGRTATRFITSGVLETVPDLQLLLAHAGGTLPATIDRLVKGWQVGLHPRLASSPLDLARRAFWADSVAYAAAPLRAAMEAFSAGRIVYGSDYPFSVMMTPRDLHEVIPDPALIQQVSDAGAQLLAWVSGTR